MYKVGIYYKPRQKYPMNIRYLITPNSSKKSNSSHLRLVWTIKKIFCSNICGLSVSVFNEEIWYLNFESITNKLQFIIIEYFLCFICLQTYGDGIATFELQIVLSPEISLEMTLPFVPFKVSLFFNHFITIIIFKNRTHSHFLFHFNNNYSYNKWSFSRLRKETISSFFQA